MFYPRMLSSVPNVDGTSLVGPRVLFFARNTKTARGYVGAGPRYPVLAAQPPAANTLRQQRVVFGGGGSVTESDAVEKVRTDSIRRERRSRIGSEQNLDESKGSLFQSFEHFRKARLILRLLIRRERRSRWG